MQAKFPQVTQLWWAENKLLGQIWPEEKMRLSRRTSPRRWSAIVTLVRNSTSTRGTELTEIMWAMELSTPNAPNRAPAWSEAPRTCRHIAPRDCSAGLPPLVKDDKHERTTKRGSDWLETVATRASASPSTNKDIWARYLSNTSSAAISDGEGGVPGADVGLGFR